MLEQQDDERRVDAIVAQMKAAADKAEQAADVARKATAKASFYLFFSMLKAPLLPSVAGAMAAGNGTRIEEGCCRVRQARRLSLI